MCLIPHTIFILDTNGSDLVLKYFAGSTDLAWHVSFFILYCYFSLPSVHFLPLSTFHLPLSTSLFPPPSQTSLFTCLCSLASSAYFLSQLDFHLPSRQYYYVIIKRMCFSSTIRPHRYMLAPSPMPDKVYEVNEDTVKKQPPTPGKPSRMLKIKVS